MGTTGRDEPGGSAASANGSFGTSTGFPSPAPASTMSGGTNDAQTGGAGGEDCAFLGCEDAGPNALECSTLQQDCPSGQKCTVAPNHNGHAWSAMRCVPVDATPDGIDEPCHAEDQGVSGLDSCDVGSLCWGVDAETLEGRCVPYCTGSLHDPGCADPNRYCPIYDEGLLWLCVSQCDPLDPSACPPGQGCYPRDGRFSCIPIASKPARGVFDPCDFTNSCEPGSLCVTGELIPTCEASRCCTTFCDLEASNCPDETVCSPLFQPGDAVPGYEDTGFCIDGAAR